MAFLQNLKIGLRMSLGYGVLILISVVLTLLAAQRFASVSAEVEGLTERRMKVVGLLTQMRDNAFTIATAVRNIALLTEVGQQLPEKQSIDAARKSNSETLKALEDAARGSALEPLLAQVGATRAPYRKAIDAALEQALAGDADSAINTLLTEARPLQKAYFKALDDIIEHERVAMAASALAIRQQARRDTWILASLAAGAALLGGLLAWATQRSVVLPIRQAVDIARTVASGDLRTRIQVERRDETGELLQAMREMTTGLTELVTRVRESSEQIATGAAEIANGSTDLSQRTESQASNLQETASSMEQISGTVRQSAETAQLARELAQTGVQAARDGGSTMARVIGTMDEISQSSRKVADIIGVIDGIAFQTNILALNAAVEAARAGEQGRGFAVVASEVRTLAQRSGDAAREIRGLIHASVERVESGHALVGEAGQSMQALVSQVQRVGDLVSDISLASSEQNSGLSQISAAVQQLDHVTQQNAALVEQSTAAAQGLRDQADRLAGLVRRFQTA